MSWVSSVFNFLAGAQYSATPTAIADGATGPLLMDRHGRLHLSVAAGATVWIDPAVGTPLTYQRVASAVPAGFVQVLGSNEGVNSLWFMLFDSASLASNGNEPRYAFKVPAGASFAFELGRARAMVNGIAWAASSTAGTLTIDATATFRVNFEVSA